MMGLCFQPKKLLVSLTEKFVQWSIPPWTSQRDDEAPIFRLPSEVLGIIFAFVSATEGPRSGRPLSLRFNFSHVCQRWRSVALNTPEIWCSIPFRDQGWAPVVLERAKSADLMVNEDFYAATLSSPFVLLIREVLMMHTERIRELSLTNISTSLLCLLLSNLELSSLRLRSFRLGRSLYDNNNPFLPTEIPINTEILQTLDVVSFGIDWFRFNLTHLVTLKIHQTPNRPPWTDFITSLQGMPVLEILDLNNSLPLADDVHRRPRNPVRLTRLRQLFLASTTDMNEVLNVLSFIVVPQSATLYFHAKIIDSTSDLSSTLSPFISEMGSEHDENSVEKLCYQKLTIVCNFLELDILAWVGEVDTPNLRLSIFNTSRPGPQVLQEVLPVLPMAKLVTLKLDTDITIKPDFLVATLGNLSHLQNVSINGHPANGFLLALSHKPDDYDTRASAYYSTSFPALHSLELRDVIFDDREVTIDSLKGCLMERCERNAEISKLSLSNCFSLYKPDVEHLRKFVVDVHWDGLEQKYSDESHYTYDYWLDSDSDSDY